MKLKVKPLTREAFLPYGDVMQVDGASSYYINDGLVQRFHDLAKVEYVEQERVLLSINCAKPIEMPIKINFLENHPLGTQAFIPLNGERFIIVAAAPGDSIDPSTIQAFITDGHQGVNYHRHVWHSPLFAYLTETKFFTVDRAGENNCLVQQLIETYELVVDE